MSFLKKMNIGSLIAIILVIIILYTLFSDMLYYDKYDDDYITNIGDFEKYESKYENSKLYHQYNLLSKDDKYFLSHLIGKYNLENKTHKPKFNKKLKDLRNRLILATLISSIIFSSSLTKVFKLNIVNYFITLLL